MKKLGGIKGILSKLPGASKIQDQMNRANIDDKVILKQQAIISSMTVEERNNHKIIHASRKKRIASGSGTSIQEVNKLLKQYHTMSKMMKKYGNMDKNKLRRQGLENILPPGLQEEKNIIYYIENWFKKIWVQEYVYQELVQKIDLFLR